MTMAQATPLSLQDLAEQLDMLSNQVDTLRGTNQLLSDSLINQIEFLKQENQALTNSFSKYVDAMKWNLTVLAGLAAVLTAVGGWIFKNNLDDAKKVAREMIDRRVEGQISEMVDARVEEVARTFRREQVISSTYVDYYLPDGPQPPSEFVLLKARKFKDVRFLNSLDAIRRSPDDVVILDLQNWVLPSGQRFIALPETERESQATLQIDGVLDQISESAVLVVYIRGRVQHLNTIGDRYVLPANNPVTLVGNAADGAYVVVGDRTLSQ
ncbi:MAG: hypothetical protein AAF327_26055 [Cyanobacteria bacterium P01_A01_bin.37]